MAISPSAFDFPRLSYTRSRDLYITEGEGLLFYDGLLFLCVFFYFFDESLSHPGTKKKIRIDISIMLAWFVPTAAMPERRHDNESSGCSGEMCHPFYRNNIYCFLLLGTSTQRLPADDLT